MKTSKEGVELIKSFETLSLTAYRCSAGVLTIGYGHTKGVREGDCITEYYAEMYLREDLATAEAAVNKAVKVPLKQCQFDALVSFVFNVGAAAFAESTLLKCINNNDTDEAIREEFARWIYAGREKLSGLVRRRQAEAYMYYA